MGIALCRSHSNPKQNLNENSFIRAACGWSDRNHLVIGLLEERKFYLCLYLEEMGAIEVKPRIWLLDDSRGGFVYWAARSARFGEQHTTMTDRKSAGRGLR